VVSDPEDKNISGKGLALIARADVAAIVLRARVSLSPAPY
jgi:hypothetical protein